MIKRSRYGGGNEKIVCHITLNETQKIANVESESIIILYTEFTCTELSHLVTEICPNLFFW